MTKIYFFVTSSSVILYFLVTCSNGMDIAVQQFDQIWRGSSICNGSLTRKQLRNICLSLKDRVNVTAPLRWTDDAIRANASCKRDTRVQFVKGVTKNEYFRPILICFFGHAAGRCVAQGGENNILVFRLSQEKICSDPEKRSFKFLTAEATFWDEICSWFSSLKFWK